MREIKIQRLVQRECRRIVIQRNVILRGSRSDDMVL